MPIDAKTFEILPHPIVKHDRLLVIDDKKELVLATDTEAHPNKEAMLRFILGNERVRLHSILQHPDRQQDFDDTMAEAEKRCSASQVHDRSI